MEAVSNIDPLCLLNGKIESQLFDYTEDELTSFHNAVSHEALHEVYAAVEIERNNQNSVKSSAEYITDYLSALSDTELEDFSTYLKTEVVSVDTPPYSENTSSDLQLTYGSMHEDTDSVCYDTPRVEMLEGYIAISSSNLQALDKFKDRVIESSNVTWEHRIKKHGDITIHSYVFNLRDGDS